jgi:hypothetical protein
MINSTPEPRRRHKRYSPPRAGVVCVPRGLWTSLLRKKNVASHLKDMSLGGLQIIAAEPLRPGHKVDVTLQFAGFPDPIVLEAAVRWCRRDTLSLKPKWNAGLSIRRLAPQQETRLKDIDRSVLG